jgi:predicted phage baseplate assembly protein
MTDVTYLPEKFNPALKNRPLTFREPVGPSAPAVSMLCQDPKKAVPQIALAGIPAPAGEPGRMDGDWRPRRDLLDCRGNDRDFVVEINNDGCAFLRFGDGEQGRAPDAGTVFSARYRIGNGPSGNLGAETLSHLVLRGSRVSGITIRPRNPLPATGGMAGESPDEVRLSAPHAYRRSLERAILAGDYAAIAGRNPKVQRASAVLRWNGSWHEARVSIDPLGMTGTPEDLAREIGSDLHRFRRAGHDVKVKPAAYVPLGLALAVCVEPDYLRAHVRQALLDRFSNRVLPGGRTGFFHPDNLTFGTEIPVSAVIAAAQEIPGVRCVSAALRRLDRKVPGDPARGALALGPREIGRLDNDPNYPEYGTIVLRMEGGR